MEKLEHRPMSDKVKERIEKEAEAIIEKETGLKPGRSLLTPMDYGEALRCIVAGIQAERQKARNEAIDEAIRLITEKEKSVGCPSGEAIIILEKLKHKQP